MYLIVSKLPQQSALLQNLNNTKAEFILGRTASPNQQQPDIPLSEQPVLSRE